MYAKIHYSPPKGGAFAPPLPPLNPPLSVATLVLTVTDFTILVRECCSLVMKAIAAGFNRLYVDRPAFGYRTLVEMSCSRKSGGPHFPIGA